MVALNCAVCGTVLPAPGIGRPRMYCSADCRRAIRWKRNRSACFQCGTGIVGRRRDVKWCSIACRNAAIPAVATARANRHKSSRKCAKCGASLSGRRLDAVVCSRRCRDSGRPRPASAEWVKVNRPRHLEQIRQWHHDNIERERQWNRAHAAEHREYVKRHRARRTGAPGSYTPAEWEQKKAEYDYRCAYCGRAEPLFADHMVPLARQELGPTNYISNIAPACRSCNSSKRDQTPMEFMGRRVAA